MKTFRYLLFTLWCCVLIGAGSPHLQAQSLHIYITGFRNTMGSVQLAVFKCQKSFEKDTPFLSQTLPKSRIRNGELKVVLNLPPDTYGIAVLDDENENGKMDYSFFVPREGFGFSDYIHSGLTRPRFSDFSFSLREELKVVKIRIKYM
jgi:uncharacterized protein (DUF2141 family)